MNKKFPLYYDFIPETYCLPSDNSEVYKKYGDKKKKVTFIVKPESSA